MSRAITKILSLLIIIVILGISTTAFGVLAFSSHSGSTSTLVTTSTSIVTVSVSQNLTGTSSQIPSGTDVLISNQSYSISKDEVISLNGIHYVGTLLVSLAVNESRSVNATVAVGVSYGNYVGTNSEMFRTLALTGPVSNIVLPFWPESTFYVLVGNFGSGSTVNVTMSVVYVYGTNNYGIPAA